MSRVFTSRDRLAREQGIHSLRGEPRSATFRPFHHSEEHAAREDDVARLQCALSQDMDEGAVAASEVFEEEHAVVSSDLGMRGTRRVVVGQRDGDIGTLSADDRDVRFGDREAEPGTTVGADHVDVGQRLDVAATVFLVVVGDQWRQGLERFGLVKFERLVTDPEPHAIAELDRLLDPSINTVERAQILDDELRPIVAELHVSDSHGVQAGKLGTGLRSADVQTVGVDGPPVARVAARVQDLEGVDRLGESQLIEIDPAEEAGLAVVVVAPL